MSLYKTENSYIPDCEFFCSECRHNNITSSTQIFQQSQSIIQPQPGSNYYPHQHQILHSRQNYNFQNHNDISIEQLINNFHQLNINDTNNQSQDNQKTEIRVSTMDLIIQSINQALSKLRTFFLVFIFFILILLFVIMNNRAKVLQPIYDKNGDFFLYVQIMNQFASLISAIYNVIKYFSNLRIRTHQTRNLID
jgi:preprotein translocase subunit SecG